MDINSQGGCLCGAIRFHVEGPILGAAACHCRDCQYIAGGAPANVIVVAKSSLRLLQGQPTSYANTADNGALRTRQFCPTCGTPLFAENAHYPKAVTIKVGTLDQREFFRPEAELWTSSAPSWHAMTPGVPAFPKGPGSK